MSTSDTQLPLNVPAPADVGTLQSMFKTVVARLMAHSQTVQELMKANMEMRAALHMASEDKSHLEAYIQSLVTPITAPVEAAPESVSVSEVPATDASVNADTVSA